MEQRNDMETLHIGGVADKSTMNLPESVKASRHSFKLEGDFPSDRLHHDDYERQFFVVEQAYPEHPLRVQVMVHVEMPESVACVLVGAHFNGSAAVDDECQSASKTFHLSAPNTFHF